MSRRPIVRIVAAMIGGLFAAVALLGVLIVVNAGEFVSSTANSLGWALPLVTGGIVGVVSWLLLADVDASVPPGETESRTETCRKCGSRTLTGWRLCPYCGSFLERAEMTATARD